MSFYINDFKQHLQRLADNVDLPYDEPAMRSKTTKTLEETYSGMGCSSCKKKQQLLEGGAGLQNPGPGLGNYRRRPNTSSRNGGGGPFPAGWGGPGLQNPGPGLGNYRPRPDMSSGGGGIGGGGPFPAGNTNWATTMMNRKRRPSRWSAGTGGGGGMG